MYKFKEQFTTLIFGLLLFAKAILPITAFAQDYEDSPFAFQNSRITRSAPNHLAIWSNYPVYMEDLNVRWTRFVGYSSFNWEFAQESKDANFNWTKFDEDIKDAQENDLFVLVRLRPVAKWDQLSCYTSEYLEQHNIILPCDLNAYSAFVKAVVERYDGDGIDDMPELKYSQKYWMIGDEPDFPMFWQDTPENFAVLFAIAHNAIKEADISAKIHMGGTAGNIESYLYENEGIPEGFNEKCATCKENGKDGFFIRVFTKLDELSGNEKFDIYSVDFHFFEDIGGYKKIKTFSYYINRMTQNFGYGNLPIWSTEMGTFSGEVDLPGINQGGERVFQTESEQAQELIKRYAYGVVYNVSKSFWEGIIAEQIDFFSKITLMDENENKKLSYYTYKLMVDKLESSDWDSIITIIDSIDNKYAYKFINDSTGEPTYVAWWDYFDDPTYTIGDSSLITLTGISSNQIIVTNAVPTYPSGNYVTNYNTAFSIDTLTVSGGSISFYLKEDPIFVEEYNAASVNEINLTNENIKIYPNPTNGIFTIEGKNIQTVEIANIIGQIIKKMVTKYEQLIIDLSEQPKGIYFVKVIADNGIVTKKIVIE